MIYIFLITLLIADSSEAQTSEEICDPYELALCVDAALSAQVVLPRTKEELDKYCVAYQTGISCMDTWIKRCLAADKQQLVREKIGGVRALMQYLCGNDTALRRDFLKEQSCWSLVSPDWSRCVDELQLATRHFNNPFGRSVDFNKDTQLCCTRDAFISCVDHVGRACSSVAGTLLRYMAWVLTQDISPCRPDDEQSRVPCAAPRLPRFSALLSVLYYVYYYI